MTLNKKFIALMATATLVPTIALAGVTLGDSVGTSEAEIRASLEKQGYTIEEFEREDGEIEVEVTLDGKPLEIEISPEDGTVISMEVDDDDGDDDNDDDDDGDDDSDDKQDG
ncbi:MAG: PepSY domain-containing protein [Rhizobiaceae bacterium]